MVNQSTNTTPDRATNNQPTVNERLDKALERLAVAGRGWGVSEDVQIATMSSELDETKQAITSLFKELVAEAKPEVRVFDDGINDATYFQQKIVDQFEQNLLKALEEVCKRGGEV